MVQDLFATVASLRAALLPVGHPSSNLTEVSNIGCRHCEAVRTGQQPNRRSSETVRTILRAFCNSGASSKLLVYIHHLDPFGAICSSCSSCPVYCQLLLKTKVNDVWTASLPDLVWRELPAAPWEARAGFQACPACLLACLPACLLACLPACLLACLPACLLALHIGRFAMCFPDSKQIQNCLIHRFLCSF